MDLSVNEQYRPFAAEQVAERSSVVLRQELPLAVETHVREHEDEVVTEFVRVGGILDHDRHEIVLPREYSQFRAAKHVFVGNEVGNDRDHAHPAERGDHMAQRGEDRGGSGQRLHLEFPDFLEYLPRAS